MSRVEELEAAIEGLSPEEYRHLQQWFSTREQMRWEDQMDADCAAGKLDFLFEETEGESAEILFRDWPSQE